MDGAGASAASGVPAASGAALESAAAKHMRKALVAEQQALVDAYEQARRADVDEEREAALEAVLDGIAVTNLRDERTKQKHLEAGGQSWNGTEAGRGTLTKAQAVEVFSRAAMAEKVWFEHNYDLRRYVRARGGLAAQDWLAGRALTLPAIDVKAALRKVEIRNKSRLILDVGNPAKRASGAQMVNTARGTMGARTTLGARPKAAELNEELADLQAKMKAVQAKKAALQREEDAARKKARTATPANARGGQLAPIVRPRRR